MFNTKKEALEYLYALGLVRKEEANPENGFFGRQAWWEACSPRVVLFRHPWDADIWPGEVVTIRRILLDDVVIWHEVRP